MHPASCTDPTCELAYVDHLRTIAVSAHATPTRKPQVLEVDQREARWQRDMPAYKTLREQGYQPPRIDGCHHLAQTATTVEQIEGKPCL